MEIGGPVKSLLSSLSLSLQERLNDRFMILASGGIFLTLYRTHVAVDRSRKFVTDI